MISLRPMLPNEFQGYLDYFLPDYAAEISANYDISPEEAAERAAREIKLDLPDGPMSSGQDLLCIELVSEQGESQKVGYLWVASNENNKSLFIYDFHIFPEHQSQGLGGKALEGLQERAVQQGLQEIRLRVAGDNVRAQKLYEAMGFHITGVNMSKRL